MEVEWHGADYRGRGCERTEVQMTQKTRDQRRDKRSETKSGGRGKEYQNRKMENARKPFGSMGLEMTEY